MSRSRRFFLYGSGTMAATASLGLLLHQQGQQDQEQLISRSSPSANSANPPSSPTLLSSPAKTLQSPAINFVDFTQDLGGQVQLAMVAIAGGTFLMGSPLTEAKRFVNESPQHPVTIQNFYLGKFAVTQTQWQQIMGSNPSKFLGGDRPIEQLDWFMAQEFTQRLAQHTGRQYRLPSEAEWEYACRAGTQTAYTFGDKEAELATYAWYSTNAENQTHPVGQKQPNAWGLYDMHGNIWEWCEDDWLDSYRNAPIDGSPVRGRGDRSNLLKIVRGGSWLNNPWNCRSASRGGLGNGNGSDRSINPGLRLALSI